MGQLREAREAGGGEAQLKGYVTLLQMLITQALQGLLVQPEDETPGWLVTILRPELYPKDFRICILY